MTFMDSKEDKLGRKKKKRGPFATVYLYLYVWVLLLSLIMGACGGDNNRQNGSVLPAPFELVSVLAGTGGACEEYESVLSATHHEYVCISASGRRFYADVPHDVTIENMIVTLHGADTDGREMRELLLNNAPATALDHKLVIYPSAKVYGIVGWIGGGKLWNGSGERTYQDNGCCVDNALEDRQFVSELIINAKHLFPYKHLSIVGVSNGGMLGYDIFCNTGSGLADSFFIVVGSYQINACPAPSLLADLTLVAAIDDEVIPFHGGQIDFGNYNPFIVRINAENQIVVAPPFSWVVENFLTLKGCLNEPIVINSTDERKEEKYFCEYGMFNTVVLTSGGHSLGSVSLTEKTEQRSDVINYMMKLISEVKHNNEFD